jgi:hypothetical protein
MDYANINAAVTRAIKEAEEFHALANELPLRVRNKVLKHNQPDYQDPIYAPWGGLFPHPRVKREGF